MIDTPNREEAFFASCNIANESVARGPPPPTKGSPVKAGGKRIPKKQEIGILERQTKKTGLEKTSAIANVAKIQMMDALNDTLEKLSHKFPAVAHMAHQKPRPALEKVTPLKRIYIIQQPRKC
ncbi:hypothetical protein JEQ12_009588 [Ovis aries]|uniref:Death-associated protein-like 1 n=1 Tax=Ovis aries TaxID=9940 RepID=A0A836D959_SHEEP|nr:hypothetical protein JEQ12_009588 [Ovis aries]